MAGNDFYKQYAVKADATLFSQIEEASNAPNNAPSLRGPEGTIEPTTSSHLGASPSMSFTGLEISAILAAINVNTGLDCTTALEIGYVERAHAGAFEAAGHKVSAAKCLIVPAVLSVSQGQDARLSCVGYPYSADGLTHPFATTGALPTGTPAIAQMFTLQHVKINTVAIGKVLGFSIAFNIVVVVRRTGQNIYPTDLWIESRAPVATIEVADLGELSDADLAGAEVTAVEFGLAKRGLTGGPFAGAGDPKLTMAKAWLDITNARGASRGDAGLTMTARAIKSGATDIIVVS
jgi:hypothetical protein